MLENEPVPLPSVVLEPDIVGFAEVPQQTPLAVTSAPPSSVTLPPETAVVVVTPLAAVVVTTGISSFLQLFRVTTPARKTMINKKSILSS
ncbi:MAG: hypothetical protein IPI69_04715 [Bacteroidales bacterium]|nr:hypothetical protein [Bacteroidales bacterium]